MIVIPTSDQAIFLILGFLAIALAGVAVVALWRRSRPPVIDKLREDVRYQRALAVYADNLRIDEPTSADFEAAFIAATMFLVNEHRIPSADAVANLQLVVAAFHREKSYELRNEALAFEEKEEYELACVYYQRAAWLQAEYDRADSQFLQTCVARVSGKSRR